MDEREARPVEIDRECRAYRSGWQDGRFGSSGSFAVNTNLAAWENLDRLAYYRGHREGQRVRDLLQMDLEAAESA